MTFFSRQHADKNGRGLSAENAEYDPPKPASAADHVVRPRSSVAKRRHCALLASVILHGALLIAFWHPSHATIVKKAPPPINNTVSFLIATPDQRQFVESPIVSGRVEPPPRKQSLIGPNVGPTKVAKLIAPWPPVPDQGTSEKPPSFFDIPTKGKQIVFVLDCSASMGRTGAFASAKRELLRSLNRLPKDAQFQIVLYNNTPYLLLGSHEWLRPTDKTIESIADMLDRQVAEGGTDHLKALDKGLWLGGDELFLLTDADDFSAEHVRRTNLRNRMKCVIHVIRMGNGNHAAVDENWRELAAENGGMYRVVQW